MIRTKPSTSTITRRYDATSREHADLFEDHIIDYIKEWSDIVSHKFEMEMKEMKEYREEKKRRKQQVKQLRSHRDKMYSINKDKAEDETPKLLYKEDKLEVANHRYEKHKKILAQIIEELIDGSWKDLYPLMANIYQLEMDTTNKKVAILGGLQNSIDKLSKITREQASSPSSVSSKTTLWRSLRTDWLNSGPVPTVPTPDATQPMAKTLSTPVPTMESEKRNDEERPPVIDESILTEREDLPEDTEQRELLGEQMHVTQGTEQMPGSQIDQATGSQTVQPLIDRQAATPYTETTQPEKDQPDEYQNKQSGLMGAVLPPYITGDKKEQKKEPSEFQPTQKMEPQDKQPGLVRSVLSPYYKGEENVQEEIRVDEPEEQQDDTQENQGGLLSSLLPPYSKGETADRDNEQEELRVDEPEEQQDNTQEKQGGLLSSLLPPYSKGETTDDNEQEEIRVDEPEEQQDNTQEKQGGLLSALLPPYSKGETTTRDNFQDEEDDNYPGKQEGDSRNKSSGLMGSLLPPYSKGENTDRDNVRDEQNTQQYDSQDKQHGLVGSIKSYMTGHDKEGDEGDERDPSQNSQRMDSQQQNESLSKQSGLVGSIKSYFKGKPDDLGNTSQNRASYSEGGQFGESQETGDLMYGTNESEYDQPAAFIDTGISQRNEDQTNEPEYDRQSAFLEKGQSEFQRSPPTSSKNVQFEEPQDDEWENINDNMRESELDQPAAFVDMGATHSQENQAAGYQREGLIVDDTSRNNQSQKDQSGSREKQPSEANIDRMTEFQNDPLREFRGDSQDQVKEDPSTATKDDPKDSSDEYAKSAAFLIDQPLAFQIDEPVTFQVVDQPVAAQPTDSVNFEIYETDPNQTSSK